MPHPPGNYLPITLVSGFLGAGKTAVLRCGLAQEPQRLAIVVMGPGGLAYDSVAVRGALAEAGRDSDAVLDLRDDDPTVRWQESLCDVVHDIAHAGDCDRLVIEVSGRLDLNTLLKVLPAAASGLRDHGLKARVDSLVTVVDGLDFYHRVAKPALMGGGPLESPIGKLVASQVKSATMVVLNKTDLISEEEKRQAREFLHLINPSACLAECAFGEVPAGTLTLPAERRLLADAMARPRIEGASVETAILPPGLSKARLFEARRPFHPARLNHLFEADWPAVIRTKGYLWLATRMDSVGTFSQAFASFTLGMAGSWWAALPEEHWPADEMSRSQILETWQEPYGDRRQQLLIWGAAEDGDALEEKLGQCLLTDDELALGAEAWATWSDPLPPWAEMEEESA